MTCQGVEPPGLDYEERTAPSKRSLQHLISSSVQTTSRTAQLAVQYRLLYSTVPYCLNPALDNSFTSTHSPRHPTIHLLTSIYCERNPLRCGVAHSGDPSAGVLHRRLLLPQADHHTVCRLLQRHCSPEEANLLPLLVPHHRGRLSPMAPA